MADAEPDRLRIPGDFTSGGACQAGAAISNGSVYWGSGYQTAFGLTPSNKLYAPSPQ